MSPTPKSIKLTYFDTPGRAELIRRVLRYGKVDFEDIRIKREDWPAMKPTSPFGSLPIMEVDGVVFAQSTTIARYVASVTGLIPSSPLDAAVADAILTSIDEIMGDIIPYFRASGEPAKQAEIGTSLQTLLPARFKFLDTFVGKHMKNGFSVGGKVSIADAAICTLMYLGSASPAAELFKGMDLSSCTNIIKVKETSNAHFYG